MKQKEGYISPAIEVIRMENEGVIASSVNGFGSGGDAFGGSTPSSRSTNSRAANTSDLEDMINDIFTSEQ